MRILTDDQLLAFAPSIFTSSPHPDLSSKYNFVSTAKLLGFLKNLGWFPVDVKTKKHKTQESKIFGLHVIYLQNKDVKPFEDPRGGILHPQIIIFNSHNGETAVRIFCGLHSESYLNGSVVSPASLGDFGMFHSNNLVKELSSSIGFFEKQIKEIPKFIELFSNTKLSGNERMEFALRAAGIRWKSKPISYYQVLLDSPRVEDSGKIDLWTIFNVVQENLTGVNRVTGKRSPAVKSIQRNNLINIALWDLAMSFANRETAQEIPF